VGCGIDEKGVILSELLTQTFQLGCSEGEMASFRDDSSEKVTNVR
jgi:hypothetical protein